MSTSCIESDTLIKKGCEMSYRVNPHFGAKGLKAEAKATTKIQQRNRQKI